MKHIAAITVLLFYSIVGLTQVKTIHVFVALCDNENQGIVRVPDKLGNGTDAHSNLYWGAMYGVKSYFHHRTDDWKFVKRFNSSSPHILDRVLFKHTSENTYLLADAYDGAQIKRCTEDFLKSANQQNNQNIIAEGKTLNFGGGANLIAYIGHDGLMEFDVNVSYGSLKTEPSDVIILACYSKDFFSPEIIKAQATPIVWTTHLMAPEAYTLKAAIDGWLLNESANQLVERAAQAYHKYQKCGIKGARNLFTTGFDQ